MHDSYFHAKKIKESDCILQTNTTPITGQNAAIQYPVNE